MGKPIYLKIEKEIKQPLNRVWEAVAMNFGEISVYSPAIKSSRLESQTKNGLGTKRHCDFEPKGYVKEEIIEWNEKQSFKLKMTESSVPMFFLESTFSFREEGGKTIVTQEFWFRMKAPMGWMSRFMKGKMKSTLEDGLKGLDNFLKR